MTADTKGVSGLLHRMTPPVASPTTEQPAVRRRMGRRGKKSLTIPRAAFSRLVRELGNNLKSHLLWKSDGIDALQEATEDLITRRFNRAARIARLCKVDTITREHFSEMAGGARNVASTLDG